MAFIELTEKEKQLAKHSPSFRVKVAQKSFFHFLRFYFHGMFELEPATFHTQLINTLESDDTYIAVIGFRGSAKSTFIELYALWAMLTGKNNFIVMIGSTLDDAKMNIANIRNMIEENMMLKADFGINLEKRKQMFNEKWTEGQLTIGDCTIMARSKGSKIRGAKFKKSRIDMIICDDLEDVEDTRTIERRKKTRQWFFTEVLPATKQGVLATDIKVVMIGNLVHRDCLLKYMQRADITTVHEFPLLDKETGEITWPALYPDMNAVEREKEKVMIAGEGMGPVIWAREYLLVDADEEDMIISESDFKYYPAEWLNRKVQRAGVGNDLAISKNETADYTAYVSGYDVNDDEGMPKLLLLPNGVIIERLDFTETIRKAVDLDEIMPHNTTFFVEDVAYQKSAIEMYQKNGIKVEPMKPQSDKHARAVTACHHVKTGRVLFPPRELWSPAFERFVQNLLGFGVEQHDDPVDAFSMLVIAMVSKKKSILFG